MLKRAGYRFHQDFLMPSRLGEYGAMLKLLKQQGYTFVTMRELSALATGAARAPGPVCVLRNDVDSDVRTAHAMFEIDRSTGVSATYYFRLSTLNTSLMQAISAQGSEVGYHYEEVATYAKRHALRSAEEVYPHLPRIRKEFAENMERYRQIAGSYPDTVASHGDFANRKLGLTNACIVDDELRAMFNIIAEAYDPWLMKPVVKRLADASAPYWWLPEAPAAALESKPSCLYVLVHPRQWRANRVENAKVTAKRLGEGASYRFRTRGRRWASA